MTILQLLLLSPDNSTCSPLDFLAKTSAQTGTKKALWKAPDRAYFSRSPDSFASVDPVTSYWKTSQLCFLATEAATWEQYSGSFPKSGTMRSGKLFQQVHWEPPTSEKGCGLLPTPMASDLGRTSGKDVKVCKGGILRRQKEGKEKNCLQVPNVMNYLERPDLAISPSFREEMMGYPEVWTLLND